MKFYEDMGCILKIYQALKTWRHIAHFESFYILMDLAYENTVLNGFSVQMI